MSEYVPTRVIVARGLTPSDRGKNVVIGGHTVLLRNVEHLGGKTYLDVVTRIQVDGREEVEVWD